MKSRIFKLVLALVIFLSIFTSVFASSQMDADDLIYSTYLGGELVERANSMAVDGQGNAYVTGVTQSVVFPTATKKHAVTNCHSEVLRGIFRWPRARSLIPFGMTPTDSLIMKQSLRCGVSQNGIQAVEHGLDAFVAKISPDGKELLYVLWFNAINASDVDEGLGIAVDDQGHAYVTGHTRSPDFCEFYGQVPGYESTYNGDGDAFLLKIKPDGSGLDYCTFLGGSDWDSGSAVIIDNDGNATITGGTWSDNFPTTDNAASDENTGQRDVFITTLDDTGTKLRYSTYLGGNGQEHGRDLIVVGNRIAVAGWTNSANFPTKPGGYDASYDGKFDAFLAQIDLNSGSQTYGSFLGGDGEDRAAAIAATADGQILVAGTLLSTPDISNPTFPTTPGALKSELGGESDAFLVKFNVQASGLVYGTLIGGDGQEQGLDLSINNQDDFAVSGSTNSTDFPTTGQAYQLKHQGLDNSSDAFISQFNPDSSLVYSSYFGGDQEDSGRALYLTDNQQLFLTGSTRSENFPTSPEAASLDNQGDYDVFISRLILPPPVDYQVNFPLILLD